MTTDGPAIVVHPNGFNLTVSGTTKIIFWHSIERVVALKQDLGTHDMIVLLVDAHGAPEPVVLAEEMPGFADLFAPMETHLGVSPAWYPEIMLPAFEPTPMLLYSRTPDPNA
ncbi:MAG: hypothetical protein U0133_17715 [Gemmatimonadales bacterium]